MSKGQRSIGKYELLDLLGRGGMAEVWKGFDPNLQRYVAIKILHTDLQNDPDFIKRFEREARAIASLRHPHIVQVHDFQLVDPTESGNIRAYMVMKYIEGSTLTEYIHRTSRVGKFPSAADIIHLFATVGTAIDYAHQKGMIHRDIKPSNIILDKRAHSRYQIGEPVLTDFGIVKLIGASTGTLSGWWVGTPSYISPEQAQGHQGNERSDIYSLSVILYEICTGTRPFLGETPLSIIMQHISNTPTSPELINPNIPPALAEVIMCGLAKDPEARFPNASALTEALTQTLNPSPPLGPGSRPYPLDSTGGQSNRTPVLPSDTPPSPISPLPHAALSTPQFATASDGGQRASMTPPGALPPSSLIGMPSTSAQSLTPVLRSPESSSGTGFPRGKQHAHRIVLYIALFALLLVGSNLGTFYLASQLSSVPPTTIVGQAYFVSSGQLSNNLTQGINDELQINVHGIPQPASGKRYYAWLSSDSGQSSTTYLLLGALTVNAGNIDFLYPGDASHTNLLGSNSQFLITEESPSTVQPNQPSLNQERYRAGLPHILGSNGLSSVNPLDAYRYLLYDSSIWTGIHSSLEVQFYQNMQKVLAFANDTSSASLQTEAVRILDYLVGTTQLKAGGEPCSFPVGNTMLDTVNVPLLSGLTTSSYAQLITTQMSYISSASDATSDIVSLTNQINTSLQSVENSLVLVRKDAEIVACANNQSSVGSTFADMGTQADHAFYGYVDSSGNVQEGVVWIHENIQRLAVFNVSKV